MPIPEAYRIWAPPERVWSQWAKPVLFAQQTAPASGPRRFDWPRLDAPDDYATALVLELRREAAIDYGVSAAMDNYWPVPLFNCAFGTNAVLNVRGMIDRLGHAAEALARLSVPREAPPAFLVDSHRMQTDFALAPGNLDNRYLMLPQDFPSAGFLLAHGIRRVVWVHAPSEFILTRRISDDLAHVFRRWQEGGLPVYQHELGGSQTQLLDVKKPSMFRSLFYRAFILAGLRRNSAGGFGGIIPHPSSGG